MQTSSLSIALGEGFFFVHLFLQMPRWERLRICNNICDRVSVHSESGKHRILLTHTCEIEDMPFVGIGSGLSTESEAALVNAISPIVIVVVTWG